MAVRHRSVDAAAFVGAARHASNEGRHMTIEIGDASYELDDQYVDVFISLIDLIRCGSAVELEELPEEVSTGQAADLLGLSRPTVVKLVDSGELPSSRIGSHRRIPTTEVLALRERSRRDRRAALDDLVEFSAELGLYAD